MQLEKLRQIIEAIGARELDKEHNIAHYNLYFSDNRLLHFLLKTLKYPSEIRLKSIYTTNSAVVERSFHLELHKKSGVYYLGYYSGRRHFKYFRHFFKDILADALPIALYSERGFSVSFMANRTESFGAWHEIIEKQKRDFGHSYSDKLTCTLSQFSNTDLPLKMILMDSQGDFYQIVSRLWSLKFPDSLYFPTILTFFENCSRSWHMRSDVRKGFYFSVDKRIVQVSYRDTILDKTAAIPEAEFYMRENYWINSIKNYQKNISNL